MTRETKKARAVAYRIGQVITLTGPTGIRKYRIVRSLSSWDILLVLRGCGLVGLVRLVKK